MDAFWKWLMRANARWVLYCAVAALILVIGWWTWKEFSPLEQEPPIPSSALKEAPLPSLGLDALLEKVESRMPTQVPANVFMAMDAQRPPPAVDVNPTLVNPPVKQPDGGGVRQPVVTSPQQPPPKQRDTVSLIYRGLFRRTDGKTMALIEDSKSKSSSFYSVSNELFGVKVGAVDTNEAAVTLNDGSSAILKLGQPAVFEGGKRAN